MHHKNKHRCCNSTVSSGNPHPDDLLSRGDTLLLTARHAPAALPRHAVGTGSNARLTFHGSQSGRNFWWHDRRKIMHACCAPHLMTWLPTTVAAACSRPSMRSV